LGGGFTARFVLAVDTPLAASVCAALEQPERERLRLAAEQLERDRQRVDNLKTQWAQVSAAQQHDLLAAHQRATYYEKAQKLIALINGE
jgi:hypothetical protein